MNHDSYSSPHRHYTSDQSLEFRELQTRIFIVQGFGILLSF